MKYPCSITLYKHNENFFDFLFMKPILKRFFIITSILFTLAAPYAYAQSTKPVDHSGYNMVGYLKTQPLQGVSKRFMQAARKIYPSPQVELLPLMALGSYGYPEYPGLSTKEPMTLFFYQSKGANDIIFIGVAAIRKASLVYDTLKEMQFAIREENGYIYFAQKDEDFKVAGNLAELAEVNRAKTRFDIKLKIIDQGFASEVKDLKNHSEKLSIANGNKTSESAQEDLPSSPEEDWLEGAITAILEEIDHLESLTLGVKITESHIWLYNSTKVHSGNNLYDLLSQEAGGGVAGAQYFDGKDALAISVFKADPRATRNYIYYFIDQSMVYTTTTEGKAKWRALKTLYDVSLKKWDGSSLKIQKMNDGRVVLKQVIGGAYTHQDLVEADAMLANKSIEDIASIFYKPQGQEGGFRIEAMPNAWSVGSIPINTVEIAMKPEESQLPLNSWSFFSPMENNQGWVVGRYHDAVMGGDILIAYDKNDMASMVKTIQEKKALPNNMAKSMPLNKGEIFKMRVDLGHFATAFLLDPETFDTSMLKGLEPMMARAKVGQGKVAVTCVIPIDSMAEITRTYRSGVEATPAPNEVLKLDGVRTPQK